MYILDTMISNEISKFSKENDFLSVQCDNLNDRNTDISGETIHRVYLKKKLVLIQ